MNLMEAPENRIEGERLYLRPITAEDTEMVLSWRNAPSVRNNYYYRALITREEHEKWLREKVAAGLVYQYIVCLKEGDEPIGCVFLQRYDAKRRSMESGIFMSEDAPSGQGYGSEAVRLLNFEVGFARLHLQRSIARVLGYNTASRKLHEKAGFTLVKILEHDAFLEGKWEDTVCYELENPEYHVPNVYPLADADPRKILTSDQVSLPGSKSITNRALLLALLAKGETALSGVLFSDDSRHFLQSVQDLGFDCEIDEDAKKVKIRGLGGGFPKQEAGLYVGSAGTAARFLSAVLGVTEGTWHLDASEQMRKRPMEPLLRSLEELGCTITFEGEGEDAAWRFPYTLQGHGFATDEIGIEIGKSSQFLSALLIASVLYKNAPGKNAEEFRILAKGSHGMAYVEMTARMMEQFGVTLQKEETPEGILYRIPAGQQYAGRAYEIEPDVSAAAYFYALCPLLGISVQLPVHSEGLQGDVGFLRILEQMGCVFSEDEKGIRLDPPADGRLRGITADMSACSDQAITLAAIAPFAEDPVKITGIGHIRLQESDRIAAMETELKRMGIRAESTEDSLTVYPGTPAPARIETYGDHRIAMGFALTGLRAPGITILDPGCCKKTFEDFFVILEDLFGKD